MRVLLARNMKSMTRFATVLATVVAGVSFVMISSAAAAPVDKKIDVENPVLVQKIVKAESTDSKPFFNNRPFFNDRPFFNNRPFFNDKPFFNNGPFFNPFFRPNFFDEDFD